MVWIEWLELKLLYFSKYTMFQSFKSVVIEFRNPLKEKLRSSLFCQDSKHLNMYWVTAIVRANVMKLLIRLLFSSIFYFYTRLSKSAVKLFLWDIEVFPRVYVYWYLWLPWLWRDHLGSFKLIVSKSNPDGFPSRG